MQGASLRKAEVFRKKPLTRLRGAGIINPRAARQRRNRPREREGTLRTGYCGQEELESEDI